ncbi:MAG: DUF5706 domain-containing protein [Armatimonas sp.]
MLPQYPINTSNSITEINPIDSSWKTLTIVNEWVRFLDGKAAAILAADAAVAAVTTSIAKSNANYLKNHYCVAISLGLAAICLVTSAVRCLYCVAPTLHRRPTPFGKLLNVFSSPYYEAISFEKSSVLYFNEIPETVPAYRAASDPVFSDPNKLQNDLADQITAVAKIARGKSLDIGRAVQFLIWAFAFAIVAFLIFLVEFYTI